MTLCKEKNNHINWKYYLVGIYCNDNVTRSSVWDALRMSCFQIIQNSSLVKIAGIVTTISTIVNLENNRMNPALPRARN